LTVAELAEASVESDRATTSDKRKRRCNTMDPPRINSISVTLVLGKTFLTGRMLLRSATAIPIGAQVYARCGKHLQIAELVK
jgi:hypothetical protein